MPVRSITLYIGLLIATASIGLGYIRAGYWLILPAFLLMALSWRLVKGQSGFWWATGLLIAYLGLAAFGIAVDLSLELMLVGGTFALASWDLILFNQGEAASGGQNPDATLERNHLLSLALATVTGLALAMLSAGIELRFPFGVTVLLVLVALGGLAVGRRYLLDKQS